MNQKQNPAQVLADLLAESLDPDVFYKLVREHDLDLAPKRVGGPRAHAEYITDEALALFVKDWGSSRSADRQNDDRSQGLVRGARRDLT